MGNCPRQSPSVTCCASSPRRILGYAMTPQSRAVRRSPRVRLPCVTPVVLRSQDGSRKQGELKLVSLTGGLVYLPDPLDCHSRVKLKFVTPVGTIDGSVEMLKPVSADLQPFRFKALGGRGQRKLRATIQLHLGQNSVGEESIDKYRESLVRGTFFGDLFGFDAAGDDWLGVNRDPEKNCPICGIAGHNHTVEMTRACATKLLRGDDQTGKASETNANPDLRFSAKRGEQV